MSIFVQKTQNESSRIFVFEGKVPTFPKGEHLFTDRNEAVKAGFYGAGDLLDTPRVKSVKSLHSKSLVNYDRGSWDAVEVTLKEGYSWNNLVKGSQQTIEDRYAQILQNTYYLNKTIFFNDVKAGNDMQIVAWMKGYLTKAMANAASTAQEVTERRDRGIPPLIYDKIKVDHGEIRFTSYWNDIAQITLSGNCGSDCPGKSPSATISSLHADWSKGPLPNLRQIACVLE